VSNVSTVNVCTLDLSKAFDRINYVESLCVEFADKILIFAVFKAVAYTEN